MTFRKYGALCPHLVSAKPEKHQDVVHNSATLLFYNSFGALEAKKDRYNEKADVNRDVARSDGSIARAKKRDPIPRHPRGWDKIRNDTQAQSQRLRK